MKRIYLFEFAKLVLNMYWGAISAIRDIKFLLCFVWVTSCFNSDTIRWSPLKNLRVVESLLNGQACDFSRFFWDSSFWKVPSSIHVFKVINGDTRIMYQICSKSTIKKLRWRYWLCSVVFIVVNFERILHIVMTFSLLDLKN